MRRSQWLDITVGFPMAEVKQTPPDSSSFFGRMNRAFQGRLPEYAAWQSELTCRPLLCQML